MVPTASCPRTRPGVVSGTSPFRMCRSVPQIVVASTCTMTSLSCSIFGSAISLQLLRPGPSYTSAFMFLPPTRLLTQPSSASLRSPDRPKGPEGPGGESRLGAPPDALPHLLAPTRGHDAALRRQPSTGWSDLPATSTLRGTCLVALSERDGKAQRDRAVLVVPRDRKPRVGEDLEHREVLLKRVRHKGGDAVVTSRTSQFVQQKRPDAMMLTFVGHDEGNLGLGPSGHRS